jgi:hypothetical protein
MGIGNRRDVDAELFAEVDDDGLDLLLGPFEEAIVRIDD